MWNFLAQIAIAVVLSVVAYLLAPKPPRVSQQSQDLREPTAEAGIPVPVPFGELTITSPNVMWYGDVRKRQYEVKA